ncbi:MAG: hybrid sensor histidine kinase/response regulator [Planctomycetota bacterium]|nr:hybrid sensor histidine kinase/response regulator [Planctomycetota bacterium]
MVDRAKLLERLMATFVDELDDHVQTLNEGVLGLEKGVDVEDGRECLAQLFRAAHSLKGAARAVDQPTIEQLCHVLEDVYGGIRDGRLQPTSELCTLMLRTADAIGEAGQRLREKQPLDVELLELLRSAVTATAAGKPFEMPPATPAAGDPPTANVSLLIPAVTAPHVPESSALPAAVVARATAPQGSEPPENIHPPTAATPTTVTAASEPEDSPAVATAPAASRASSTVRVAHEKLDLLLAQTGELLVTRQRIDTHPREIETLLDSITEWKRDWESVQRALIRLIEGNGVDPLVTRSTRYATRLIQTVEGTGERLRQLEKKLEQLRRKKLSDARQLNVVGNAVQDEVHHIRMVPFEEACAGLERAVRDIATSAGKEVELVLKGGDIEVDRSVINGLAGPLLHLVRNAVDHGIETATLRKVAGKATIAQVTVSASLRGSQMEVVVADDGQGLDLEKIRTRVRQRGLPEPSNEQELVNCICLPGFSTAEIITDVSGRGVGMDVVKSQVEELRGTVEIATQSGLGTRFTILVPLTLTTINAVFVNLGGQPFLLPTANVLRLVRFIPSDLRRIQGQETLPLGSSPVPVASLGELLGRASTPRLSESGRLTGVVVTAGDREVVLVVDEVTSEREVVIKNPGRRIQRLPHVSGAAMLQSGEIALLLNAPSLIRAVASGCRTLSVATVDTATKPEVVAQRVMVVDDSVTTRTLIRSILESAGYSVEAAVDGVDAWDRMQVSQSNFDLVVSDVDMPRMDGFRLTETIRSSARFENTPVVLVTSRDSDKDKVLGVRAGASAYLVKSDFDQSNILETIQQLI